MAHRVVIVGGGFGGLNAAKALRRAPVEVTLVDRQNYHLFQPLLYQVATGSLSPANIAAPLRAVVGRQKNIGVRQDEVTGFDLAARQVLCNGEQISYDSLILATGMTHSYFGHDEWAAHAPGLKTIDEATEIRAKVLSAFERAEWEPDPQRRQRLLTFVIVGAGPTGVELAGALADLTHHTLKHDFHHIHPDHARIILVDAVPQVLSNYPTDLSQKAARSLEKLGVTVRTGAKVEAIQEHCVTLSTGDAQDRIETETILWAAGLRATPLAQQLAEQAGAETDRPGRIKVEPNLSLPGHPEVFAIGDIAHLTGDDGQPLPGVAPVAIQQGKYVAKLIANRIAGRDTPPFRYRDLGSLATIGRASAVADFGRLKFAGYFAWLLWLFIHLMQLVEFQNRVLVFFQWTWSYVTRGRSARLITGGHRPPSAREE